MRTAAEPTSAIHHQPPGWFTRTFVNRPIAAFTRAGVSVWGSRVLEVQGRRTGQWRSTPVNLHHHDGVAYLVAPRGQTQWVRNLRAAETGRLRLGRRRWDVTATELHPDEAPAVLRSYLRRWKWEVGQFFHGVGPDAPDADLRRIAVDHPVFRIEVGPAYRIDAG